jgi:predicted nucleotidyltransferase
MAYGALPDEVENVLDRLVPELTKALGNDVIGIYLTGSAVAGGYARGVSDIDLVVVTAPTASELDVETLGAVHAEIVAHDPAWENRLEIVYIGRTTLHAFRTTTHSLAVISPGEPFHLTGPVSDWLQNWYLVATSGRTLAGPPARDVFPAIEQREFLDAIRAYVRYLAREAPGWSGARLAYAVLSACRALETVRTGEAVTKADGATAVSAARRADADLIAAALAAREGVSREVFETGGRAQAVKFIKSIEADLDAQRVS